MNKKVYLLAAAAALFAACSNNDGAESLEKTQAQTQAQQIPVTFDAYTSRNTTRAGSSTPQTTTQLQTDGFGVLAYYTNMNEYDQLSIPTFIYNSQVSTASWTYSPIKYWPNEFGGSAISDDVDKLTFFAYAPYVDVTPGTGKVTGDATTGITALSSNAAAGDPYVKYIASFKSGKSVDLLWGVADNATDVSWTIKNGGTQTIAKGLPWLNVQRPPYNGTTDKVKFYFNHALSKLTATVDAYVDGTDNTNALTAGTKILIRSITFSGIAMKGALNLNNTTPGKQGALWMNYTGSGDLANGEEVTIFDGLKDGQEGKTPAVNAANEKVLGLNADLIGTGAGVTKTETQLFEDASVLVIPTGEPINVTIVYDVETEDTNLATFLSDGETNGSSVENKITKTITFGTDTKFESNKAYTLKLHLGMNSVKFDAAVTDWDDANDEGSGLLPEN